MRVLSPVTAFVLLALTLLPVLPAAAHPGDPIVRVVLERVEPAVEGITVQVAHSLVPQLVVHNDSDVTFDVLGADGEVFLRISGAGVEADLSDPEWYRANDPAGEGVAVPEDAPDGLTRVSRQTSWAWFDHRLHPGTVHVPASARDAEEPLVLAGWAVPIRVGDRDGAVTGRIEAGEVLGRVDHRIVAEDPLPAGVHLQLLPAPVPGFLLSLGDPAPDEVVVLGRFDEPMLRVTPDGAAYNALSPTWHEHASLTAAVARPRDPADPSAAPTWVELDAPVVTWMDVRGRYDPGEPEGAVDGRPRSLEVWDLPLLVDGRRVDVPVETHWIPLIPPAPGPQLTGPMIAAALLGAAGLAYGLRRRTRLRGLDRCDAPSVDLPDARPDVAAGSAHR